MLINGKKTTIHNGLSFSFDDDGITYSTEIKQLNVDYQVQSPLNAVTTNIKKVIKYCRLVS